MEVSALPMRRHPILSGQGDVGVDGAMCGDDQQQLGMVFKWVRGEQEMVSYEQQGWSCVGRRWQESTDRWSYLMRRDDDGSSSSNP